MGYLLMILAGAFLVNCVPHLSAGLRGEAFPTPFAKPPARGLSSPRTNMLWGSGNFVVGIVLARTGWPMRCSRAPRGCGTTPGRSPGEGSPPSSRRPIRAFAAT